MTQMATAINNTPVMVQATYAPATATATPVASHTAVPVTVAPPVAEVFPTPEVSHYSSDSMPMAVATAVPVT